MNHFDIVRQIQEDTGGFTAFIPWSFQRELTSLGRFIKEEATAVEYLRTLAISRIYLDNIENIQSSWVTPGLKICQLGLRFGGNDVGSVMIEENVVSAAGTHHQATEEQLRHMIRDAGFVPRNNATRSTALTSSTDRSASSFNIASGIIQLTAQCLGHRGGVHGHRAIIFAVVNVIAHQ